MLVSFTCTHFVFYIDILIEFSLIFTDCTKIVKFCMISMNLFVLCRVMMFGETFVIQRPSIVISCPLLDLCVRNCSPDI
jgi:hypothetical protein